VERVVGNRCADQRPDRFTLRGHAKADGQWERFCLAHDVEKRAPDAHEGYAA
jgi:hypothetical protein